MPFDIALNSSIRGSIGLPCWAGLILLLVVLAGIYLLFIYWKRQYDLYRQQKNIISQVTHELKSPLASIQLHLETIRLRPLPPEKTEQFLDIMLDDVERLTHLISNLLMAAKLEQRNSGTSKATDRFFGLSDDIPGKKANEPPRRELPLPYY